jgi:serine/threonine protein kinase
MAVKKNWVLTDQERWTYGDRVPKGYEKLDLLGKGGCALVWLARRNETGETVALKQFPKQSSKGGIDPTAIAELTFGR